MPILTTEQHELLVRELREAAEQRMVPMMFQATVIVHPDGACEFNEVEQSLEPAPETSAPSRDPEDTDKLPGRELHVAATWDCDDCGREAIARTVRRSDEQVREHCNMEPYEAIGLPEEAHRHIWPRVIECPRCHQQFRVEGVI